MNGKLLSRCWLNKSCDLRKNSLLILLNFFFYSRDQSPVLSYCYSLFKFLKAILVFEQGQLDHVQKDLDKTQKLCKEFIKIHGLGKKTQSNSQVYGTNTFCFFFFFKILTIFRFKMIVKNLGLAVQVRK
jgi:hypothetical protein